LLGIRKDALGPKRLLFQVIGQIGLVLTIPKMLTWAYRLKRGPIEVYPGLQKARIPMVDAASGQEVNWAIEHLPSLGQAPRRPLSPPKATRCDVVVGSLCDQP
jgi:hypothetical protein